MLKTLASTETSHVSSSGDTDLLELHLKSSNFSHADEKRNDQSIQCWHHNCRSRYLVADDSIILLPPDCLERIVFRTTTLEKVACVHG